MSTWDRGTSRRLSKPFTVRIYEDQMPYLNALSERNDASGPPEVIRLLIGDHQVIGRILEFQAKDLRAYAEVNGITITAGESWNAVAIARLASIHLTDWVKQHK